MKNIKLNIKFKVDDIYIHCQDYILMGELNHFHYY